MHHLKRIVTVIFASAVTVIPLALANDSVRNYLHHHPAVAVYVPIVTGIVAAITSAVAPNKSGVEVK